MYIRGDQISHIHVHVHPALRNPQKVAEHQSSQFSTNGVLYRPLVFFLLIIHVHVHVAAFLKGSLPFIKCYSAVAHFMLVKFLILPAHVNKKIVLIEKHKLYFHSFSGKNLEMCIVKHLN